MDKQEFSKIALAIKSAYPNFTVLQDNASKDIWYTMLADIPYSVAQPATLELLSSNKYPPSIAELREKCTSYTSLPTRDYGEAWESVLMAVRKFGYMQELDALESMDHLTRRCIKRIGFQNVCMSDNIAADRANFRMIYETEANRKRTENQLPIALRNQKQQMIEEISKKNIVKIEKKKEEIRSTATANMDKVNELLKSFRV